MAEAYVCDIFGESIGISNRRVASELPTHRHIEDRSGGVCKDFLLFSDSGR